MITLASDAAPVALGLDPASLISLAIGTVLPLLVGLVTKRVTGGNVKALLLLGLSVVSGFLSTLLGAVQGHVTFDWVTALVTALVTFVIGVATHYGFWKPVGAAEKAQAVGSNGTYDVTTLPAPEAPPSSRDYEGEHTL